MEARRIDEYLEAARERHLAELQEFLRIPSVSTLPEHRDDVRRAAEWVADHLRGLGMPQVEVVPTGGHPVVWAEETVDPALPTVLVYGHYDVQPVDPVDEWRTPPFEPAVVDGRIYARGASDDKGQLFLHFKAMEAFKATRGRLPVNLCFLIEGEEEIGSPHLPGFVARKAERRPDVLLISDTNMPAPQAPAICYGLRGVAALELEVRGARTDLHSGLHGGAAPNPLHALARLIASLHDEEGRVVVEGFYEGVRPLDSEERRRLASAPFDADAYREELGVPALVGEPEYTVPERIGARPCIDVNGMWGGFQGEGTKTVIPATAYAKVTCRLVPDQTPDEVLSRLEEHLRRHTPPGVTLRMRRGHGGAPWIGDPDHPAMQAARRALEEVFGAPAHFIRAGGTIPVVELFSRTWGTPIVMMGFGLPEDGAHAPNESFSLDQFDRGIRALCAYWSILSGAQN